MTEITCRRFVVKNSIPDNGVLRGFAWWGLRRKKNPINGSYKPYQMYQFLKQFYELTSPSISNGTNCHLNSMPLVYFSLYFPVFHHKRTIFDQVKYSWRSDCTNNFIIKEQVLFTWFEITSTITPWFSICFKVLKCHCDEISHLFFPLFFTQNNLPSCTMSFRPKRKK